MRSYSHSYLFLVKIWQEISQLTECVSVADHTAAMGMVLDSMPV